MSKLSTKIVFDIPSIFIVSRAEAIHDSLQGPLGLYPNSKGLFVYLVRLISKPDLRLKPGLT